MHNYGVLQRSLIQKLSSLIQFESSLTPLESFLIQVMSSLINKRALLFIEELSY